MTLDLFDLQGRKVKNLIAGERTAGRYEVIVDGGEIPTGV